MKVGDVVTITYPSKSYGMRAKILRSIGDEDDIWEVLVLTPLDKLQYTQWYTEVYLHKSLFTQKEFEFHDA